MTWHVSLARAVRKSPWQSPSFVYVGVVQHTTGTLVECGHRHLSEANADSCAGALARKLNKAEPGPGQWQTLP